MVGSLCALLLAACAASGGRGGVSRGGVNLAEKPPSERDRARRMTEVVFPNHVERPTRDEEVDIVDAIARLWSEDLVPYCDAGYELVQAGEKAVPYLGYFGAVKKEIGPDQFVNITSIVLKPIFQKLEPETLSAFLNSPYSAVRAAAARGAGHRGLAENGPALLELLDDPEDDVRRAAVDALRRLSKQFFGYRPKDNAEKRTEPMRLWREWWSSNEHPAGVPAAEESE